MKISVEMPNVVECQVSQCGYNRDNACHARAITVGDGNQPHCDTFFDSARHVSSAGAAGVGACKVNGCVYNRDFECNADGVAVGFVASSVDCLTYRAR